MSERKKVWHYLSPWEQIAVIFGFFFFSTGGLVVGLADFYEPGVALPFAAWISAMGLGGINLFLTQAWAAKLRAEA